MSSSPDKNSSNINIKQSEQRLDQELNNITPVIETVIKSLFDSVNGTKSSKNTPVAILQNLNEKDNDHSIQIPITLGTKLLKNDKIQEILNNKNIQKSIDQNLDQFDRLIETPLVQQLLNTIDADPDQIKKAVHMHNASIHQRLTAFEPIVNAVHNRSEHIIDEILSHPDRLVTILFENSPDLVTNFLTKKGFGKKQLENFITQIPLKSSISKDELIKKLENNDTNGLMNKIKDELKESSIENFTLNDCLKQLTSTPNLQAFATIINLLGQSALNKKF